MHFYDWRSIEREREMVKVGVIGCGYWGPNLIRNFNGLADVDLAMISDLDEGRLNHVGLLYPNTEKTTDYKKIINNPPLRNWT